MTKTRKSTKILSLVLSLMMVLSLFSVTGTVTASADQTYKIEVYDCEFEEKNISTKRNSAVSDYRSGYFCKSRISAGRI